MRKLFLLFLIVSQVVVAQQKQMTLEDAILGRYNGLNPESFNNLKWKKSSTFTFLKNDTLWSESARKVGKVLFLSLDELNHIVKNSTGIN